MSTGLGRVELLDLASIPMGAAATTVLNSSTARVACVFRAYKTDNITGVAFSVSARAVTGGTIKAQLFGVDASGDPNTGGSELASASWACSATGRKVLAFDAAYGVTAGNYYAVVLSNTDGTPATNYPTLRTGYPCIGSVNFCYADIYASSWTKNATNLPCITPYYATDVYPAGVCPATTTTNSAHKQDSTPDEYASAFTVPFSVDCIGAAMAVGVAATTSDFSIVLYEDSTAVETLAITAVNLTSGTTARLITVYWSQTRTLTVGHTYRISILPTQTTSAVVMYYAVFDSAAIQGAYCGNVFYLSTRTDAGSWTDYNTVGNGFRVAPITPVVTGVTLASGKVRTLPIEGN